MSAPRRAAERIIAEKETLARHVTDTLYERMPFLMDKYGERGKQKCFEDMRYNLEHLAPAVQMEMPGMFAGYVEWLEQLLLSRNVSADEIAVSLELTKEVIDERFDDELAEPVNRIIRAGLAVLKLEDAS